jgi:hypothetical protein
MKSPPNNEREFLTALLRGYQSEHGEEIRHINEYKFYSLGLDPESVVAKCFPDMAENKHIVNWFKEAVARGHLTNKVTDISYCFTQAGYEKAKELQTPMFVFLRKHWKFLLPLSLSVFGAVLGYLKYTNG